MSNSQALESEATFNLERKALLDAGELVGASRLAQKLADTLGAQNMRALEFLQDSRSYEAYGYKTFAEFLDNCPSSPMTKNQYYDRKKLLEIEGDQEFDVLNSLNVPLRHRKLLAAGDVVLDGDQLIVGEKSVAINDAKAVRKAIAQAVQRFETIEAKSAKVEKEVEKLKARLEEAQANTVVKVSAESVGTPTGQALVKLLSVFAELRYAISDLPAEDRAPFIQIARPKIDHAIEDFALFCNEIASDDDFTDEDLAKLMED